MKRSEVTVSFLVTVTLVSAVGSNSASAQTVHTLLENRKVLVTSVDLKDVSAFSLPSDQHGTVWIALDPMTLTVEKKDGVTKRLVARGHSAFIRANQKVSSPNTASAAHLIIVKPKKPTQALTLLPFPIGDDIEDASDRSATLLVAVSGCRFSDTRNSGDDSEWIPGKKEIIALSAGEVVWISPGIHHFKNLGSKSSKLVSIEF